MMYHQGSAQLTLRTLATCWTCERYRIQCSALPIHRVLGGEYGGETPPDAPRPRMPLGHPPANGDTSALAQRADTERDA